ESRRVGRQDQGRVIPGNFFPLTDITMNLQDWTGRSETVEDIATATPSAALSARLARPHTARPAPGTPLPCLWHWLYFLPIHAQSEIGPDGHARRGGLPPPPAPPPPAWGGAR